MPEIINNIIGISLNGIFKNAGVLDIWPFLILSFEHKMLRFTWASVQFMVLSKCMHLIVDEVFSYV